MEATASYKHSEEIQVIITKVPPWIVRCGILIFSGILLMALSISAVIRYPDTIKLPLKIQNTNNFAGVYALVEVSQDNFTKVKIGQQVLIHLKIYSSDAYPPVKGIVNYIPDSPNEKGLFTIRIKLNDPNVKPSMKIKNWMTGSAEIITKDITVWHRVMSSLTKGVPKQ